MSRIDHATTSPVAVDPLVTLRKRTRTATLAGAAATVLAAVYALWPVSIEPLPAPVEVAAHSPARMEPPTAPPLDLAVFDGPIWLAPPQSPAQTEVAAKPAPPPPPLKLELLGILREGDSFKAVVYDTPLVDETMLARGFSRVLNLVYEADKAASTAPTAQSFREAVNNCGLDVPKLAKKLDIDRSVLADLFNGRMLAPAGRRLVEEVAQAIAISKELFYTFHQTALASPRLGQAKSHGAPTVEPQTYETIIQESAMSPERKRYWLAEE